MQEVNELYKLLMESITDGPHAVKDYRTRCWQKACRRHGNINNHICTLQDALKQLSNQNG
jgi:hypothetical protein